jgi:hypothetical protein
MSGYIGVKAPGVSSGTEYKKKFSITGTTTSLTGLTYNTGRVHLFHNGVRLVDGTDYTATDGTNITLTVAAESGDEIVVVSQASFQLSDHYTKTEADSAFLTPTGDASGLTNLPAGVGGANGVIFNDNVKAQFGAGNDLEIYHNGGDSIIADTGTGDLYIRGSNDIRLQSATGSDTYAHFQESGYAKLYHNNSEKLATTSTGVTVTQSGTDVGLLVTGGSYNYQAKFESTDAESSIVLEDSNSTNDANRIGVAGNEMRFFANNNQAITIASSGAKNFGAFKSENGGHNIYALAADSGSFAARFDGYGTGASNVVHITNGYGEVGSIKIASNGTTTNYNTGSDYRLKTDVQPVTNASSRIQELNPVNFEWIRSGTRTDGFLAHEAQAVVPDCVSGAHNEVKVWEDNEDLPDGVSVGDNKTDDDGDTIPVYQGIDQSKIVPLLTAALQEALTEIASLKTRVEALEA